MSLKCKRCEKALPAARYDAEEIAKADNRRCKGCIQEIAAEANNNKNDGGLGGLGGLDNGEAIKELLKEKPTHIFAWGETNKWHLCKIALDTGDHIYLKLWKDADEILTTKEFTPEQTKLRLKLLNDELKQLAFTQYDESDIVFRDFPEPKVDAKTELQSTATEFVKLREELKDVQDLDDAHKNQLIMSYLRDKNKSTKDGSSFSALLWQNKTIHNKFKSKFPTKSSDFYSYSFELNQFITQHKDVPESAIIRDIVSNTNNSIKTSWTQFLDDEISKLQNPTKEDIDSITSQQTYKSFLINRLQIRPCIITFTELLRNILSIRNEHPKTLSDRIERYVSQIENMIDTLNKNDKNLNIRELSDTDKLELYRRVYTYDNDKVQFRNNGPLNCKVKRKVSQWFAENSSAPSRLSLTELREYLHTLDNAILPPESVDESDESKYWRKFNAPIPIFKLRNTYRDPSKLSNTNNGKKRQIDTKHGGPSRKRVKFNLNNQRNCKYGAKCNDWINTGRCTYRHTPADIRSMNQQRSTRGRANRFNRRGIYRNNRHSITKPNHRGVGTRSLSTRGKTSSRGRGRGRGNSRGGQQQRRPKCLNGRECVRIQDNRCDFYHGYQDRQCAYCQTIGHAKYECRKMKSEQRGNNPNNGGFPRYNPTVNANPNRPQPHTNLNMEIMNIGGQPYQQVWQPLQQTQNLLQMQQTQQAPNIQRLQAQLNESKAMTKSIKNQISAIKTSADSFNTFMGKSNNYPPAQ